MQVNVAALPRRAPDSPALRRYDEVARLLTGDPHANADQGVRRVAQLCDKLEIPPLRTFGVTAADVDDLIAKAANAGSMKGNPIVLARRTPRNHHAHSPSRDQRLRRKDL